MINRIDIKYEIYGLGKGEETYLKGLKENDTFNLGNNNSIKVTIEKILSDRVLLKFDKSLLVLPNNSDEVIMKIGEEICPFLPIEPSPNFKIKLENIIETQKVFYE